MKVQSVIAGMALSGIGMVLATFGVLSPVAGAVFQEAIDVAVVLNALRALGGAATNMDHSPASYTQLPPAPTDV